MLNFDRSEIDNWASRPDAPHQLPNLIRKLILSTTVAQGYLDMPGGSGVWQAGWDGLVKLSTGNKWVPDGISVWEFSCEKGISAKASADFSKRTDDPQGVDPKDTTFVFATPRLWNGKRKWADQRRGQGKWKDVRAYDAVDLADWLELALAASAWFAQLIGRPPTGYIALDDWWQNWSSVCQPVISPALVLAGRHECAEQITEWIQQPPAHCYVQADTRDEAIAFVAASRLGSSDAPGADRLHQTVVVHSVDAWHALTAHPAPLVIIRAFDGNASPQVAVARGHHVITPLLTGQEQRGYGIPLPKLGYGETIAALTDMGLTETRAREQVDKSRRNLMSLRRFLVNDAGGPVPHWAVVDSGSALPSLILPGQWDHDNESDRAVVANLAGQKYEDIEREATYLSQTDDRPLTKTGSIWHFSSHEEAWFLLAPYLTQSEVDRFQETASSILAKLSPEFDLPVDERWLASIKGKAPTHSTALRVGIARTLAFMGNIGERAKNVANIADLPHLVLRRALEENEGWQIWATLGNDLPTLAEAAPEVLLSAVARHLAAPSSIFSELFAQEGGRWFSGAPHTGLLWALERLAWAPEHFTRVAIILARLALIDPGGTTANRPARSLAEMFVPGLRMSGTLDAQRLETLETLLNRYPDAGWRALANAYPYTTTIVSDRKPPSWIPLEQAEPMKPTPAEYYGFIAELARLLLDYAGGDAGRWADVVGIISTLHSELRRKATDLMTQRIAVLQSDPGATALRAKLRMELHRHRSHPDAQLALPADDLETLAGIYRQLTPDDPAKAYGWLFDAWPYLPEGTDYEHETDSAKIDAARHAAISAAYASGGSAAIVSIAKSAQQPWHVGRIWATSVGTDSALELATAHASSGSWQLKEMADGALRAMYQQSGWSALDDAIRRLKAAGAPPQAVALVHLAAPATPDTWRRLAREGSEVERCYWEQINPYWALRGDADGIRYAAERLLAVHRAPAVAECIAYEPIHHEIVIQTLEQLPEDLAAGTASNEVIYAIVKLLAMLDESTAVGDDTIARLELPFLPVLRYNGRVNLAIYRVISNDPGLFADLIAQAYRRQDGQMDAGYNAQATWISGEILTQIIIGEGEIPGKTPEGSIDYELLAAWVNEARRLCDDRGLATKGDSFIGHLLAKSPKGADGAWPCEPVRELLDVLSGTTDSRDIDNGFVNGAHNLRGITTRAMLAGGGQERALEADYQRQASAMSSKWPHTATLLRRIADSYQRGAQWHDQRADEMDEFGV